MTTLTKSEAVTLPHLVARTGKRQLSLSLDGAQVARELLKRIDEGL